MRFWTRVLHDSPFNFFLRLFVLGLSVSWAAAWYLQRPQGNPASIPAPRNSVYLGRHGLIPVLGNRWLDRHEDLVRRAQRGGIDLLFVGDSITEAWTGPGRSIWEQRYAPFHAANFGISGDRTEHLLWRLQNGELKGIQPKVAVVLIGTNNLGRQPLADTPAQIADGVAGVLREFEKASPQTKILLLAVLPREQAPQHSWRRTIAQLNRRLADFEDGQRVFFLDTGEQFLQPDGTLSPELMPDFLHPSKKGYAVLADAMAQKLDALLETNHRYALTSEPSAAELGNKF